MSIYEHRYLASSIVSKFSSKFGQERCNFIRRLDAMPMANASEDLEPNSCGIRSQPGVDSVRRRAFHAGDMTTETIAHVKPENSRAASAKNVRNKGARLTSP
jgi:hypothetical protein